MTITIKGIQPHQKIVIEYPELDELVRETRQLVALQRASTKAALMGVLGSALGRDSEELIMKMLSEVCAELGVNIKTEGGP